MWGYFFVYLIGLSLKMNEAKLSLEIYGQLMIIL